MFDLIHPSLLASLAAADLMSPQAQVLLYTAIVFGVVLTVLWKFAWGPLMKALQDREDRIAKRIGDAEEKFRLSEGRLQEYEAKIAKAKEEAAEIIAEGKRDVEKVRQEIMAAAQEEAGRTLERAKREIHLAKDSAVQELRDKMIDLTTELASRVLKREVKEADHSRLIEEAIDQLGNRKN